MPQTLNPTGAPAIFGGLGRLEFSQGGPDDPFPVWTDITVYVRTEDDPVRITRGRQTELDQVQPSQLTCTLDNTDGRFTFGLTSGPYGPNWAPAKKVRYSETVGSRTFVRFTGWIEFPDIDNWQPIGRQYVRLTCTDRLTRLSRGQKFVSTLAAYVLNKVRNGALKGYWPMAGSSLSFPDITGQQPPMISDPEFSFAAPPNLVAPQFNNTVIAPGDDLATLVTGYDPAGSVVGTSLASSLNNGAGIPLLAGQVVTVIAWMAPVFPTTDPNTLAGAIPAIVTTAETPSVSEGWIGLFGATFADGPHWTGGALGTNRHYGSNSSATLPRITDGWALPFMVQYGFSPDAGVAMFGAIDLGPYTFLGSNPTTVTLTKMRAPVRNWAGGIGHVQLYVGAPGDFTVADYLAQVQAGMIGLEYQTTGQRINTVLDYAGVPATDRAIDPGVSFMQKAKLANLDPMTAIQDAATTERGRFFAGGDGRAVFHDRVRIYNV